MFSKYKSCLIKAALFFLSKSNFVVNNQAVS